MERVPVIIIVVAAAGLTASMLLAGLGVEHLPIRARAAAPPLPAEVGA
jgi:hypothetical protein